MHERSPVLSQAAPVLCDLVLRVGHVFGVWQHLRMWHVQNSWCINRSCYQLILHPLQNLRRQQAAQRKRIRKKDDAARASRTAEEQVQHDLFGDEGPNAGTNTLVTNLHKIVPAS